LAFNDDHESIKWILDQQEELNHMLLFKLMQRTVGGGLTPLCVAGTKKNTGSLHALIEYFSSQSCQDLIKEQFK